MSNEPLSGMVLYFHLFPEQAKKETRVIRVLKPKADGLPSDSYELFESYCVDPHCDCQRVLLNVWAGSSGTITATIGYGFDREAEDAGPYLDPLNPQGPYAEQLLDLVSWQLEADPAYVARLHLHYSEFKEATRDPGRRSSLTAPRPGRNAACSCGSGKKYKRCCGR